MPDIFEIKTEKFEGPLDLLLSLIEKRKFHISDISLAKVADDYIAYIRSLQSFPIADSANFILVASTLVLIKSKNLLPTLQLTEEEEKSIDDLESRLRQLEKIRELALHIKTRFGNNILFSIPSRKRPIVFSPDKAMTVAGLAFAIQETLKNLPKEEKIPKAVVAKVMSLEEMVENITKRVAKELKTSFREFSGMGKSEKVHIIVSFLAMLELVKQGIINVTQESKFDDIMMETEQVNTPRY
ncbi:MAG: ScpA family protein [bacterium]|nr:ScpA family protein [bacterium]